MLDGEIGHDAQADLHAPKEARDKNRPPGPVQTLRPFADYSVEGFLDFLLDGSLVLAVLPPAGLVVQSASSSSVRPR
jgi:hypothetical protein